MNNIKARLRPHQLVVPFLLGAGILATLFREILFAKYLGTSVEMEKFRLAFSVPHALGQSLAPAFIGAMLPVLVAAQNRDTDTEKATLRAIAQVSIALVGLIALIGALTTEFQTAVLAPGFSEELQRSLQLSLIFSWLYFLCLGFSFLPRLILNNEGVFWPGISAGLIVSAVLSGAVILLSEVSRSEITASGLSRAAILSGVAVLIIHILRVRRRIEFSPGKFNSNAKSLISKRGILVSISGVFILHVLNSFPRFMDRAAASELGEGVVAALDYSFNILTVPGILLGTTILTVLYPGFVRRMQDINRRTFSAGLVFPVFFVLILGFATGIGVSIWAEEIVKLVYQRGQFGKESLDLTVSILRWHAIGLGLMISSLVLLQASLAYRILWALLIIGGLRLLSKWLALELLVPAYGISGLAASFVVPELMSTICLVIFLVVAEARNRRRGIVGATPLDGA